MCWCIFSRCSLHSCPWAWQYSILFSAQAFRSVHFSAFAWHQLSNFAAAAWHLAGSVLQGPMWAEAPVAAEGGGVAAKAEPARASMAVNMRVFNFIHITPMWSKWLFSALALPVARCVRVAEPMDGRERRARRAPSQLVKSLILLRDRTE